MNAFWSIRRIWAAAAMAVILSGTGSLSAASAPVMELNVDRAAPRRVEEQTAKAIVRGYQAAWLGLEQAMEQNRPEPLADLWTGFAKQQLLDTIGQQQASGIRVRYTDLGHELEARFYSAEGSALELRDTVTLKRTIMDGGKVVASDKMIAHYVVVMTPTADHWQVRIFQSVPE